jgi:hypothetical protein
MEGAALKVAFIDQGSSNPSGDPAAGTALRVSRSFRNEARRRLIESGRAKSITDLAEQEGVTDAYVCRLLPLTCLAPDIVEAILDGRRPKSLADVLGSGPLDGTISE